MFQFYTDVICFIQSIQKAINNNLEFKIIIIIRLFYFWKAVKISCYGNSKQIAICYWRWQISCFWVRQLYSSDKKIQKNNYQKKLKRTKNNNNKNKTNWKLIRKKNKKKLFIILGFVISGSHRLCSQKLLNQITDAQNTVQVFCCFSGCCCCLLC